MVIWMEHMIAVDLVAVLPMIGIQLRVRGEHVVQVILVDGWNNSTVLTPISVIVDNIDQDDIHPTAVITEPASGQTISGNVLVETLVIDNIEIDKVNFILIVKVYTQTALHQTITIYGTLILCQMMKITLYLS